MKNTVSLIKYEKAKGSVSQAIDMCNGFQSLKTSSRVLIKPNLVGWDNKGPYPLFGVLTTSKVLEEIIICLKERGLKNIAIGEASITCKDIGSSTEAIFNHLGYRIWKEKYGVELVDFNKEKMKEIDLDGHKINITAWLDECDFLIDVPVLKTHGTTVVSLGMKNLKGLMNKKSKSYFHHGKNIIDHLIVLLTEHVKPSLTIIDGLYALERGPLHTGRAYRKDVLLASEDTYGIDAVGAAILGYDVSEVPHLKEYASRHQRTTDLSDIHVVGNLMINDVRQRLEWDMGPWDEIPAFFIQMGLEGFRFPKPDHTLCTGCSYLLNPLIHFIISAKKDVPFDNYEVLTGKIMEPSGNAKKTFLFGNCIIKARKKDPQVREAVPMIGCPPKFNALVKTFKENGVDANPEAFFSYRGRTMKRYLRDPSFDIKDYYVEGAPPSN